VVRVRACVALPHVPNFHPGLGCRVVGVRVSALSYDDGGQLGRGQQGLQPACLNGSMGKRPIAHDAKYCPSPLAQHSPPMLQAPAVLGLRRATSGAAQSHLWGCAEPLLGLRRATCCKRRVPMTACNRRHPHEKPWVGGAGWLGRLS